MQFNITVVQATLKTAMSKANKPYKLVELAYRNNTFDGKLEESKINQYSKVFQQVSAMQAGESYTVEKEKDDSGYYQWLSVVQQAPGTSAPTAAPAKNEATTPYKSTYETPEERAKKQVYIVRQSSISAAIDLLSIGAKTPPSTELILKEAKAFEAYVFGNLFDEPNDLDVTAEIQ